ncbi:MAG: hypothetical protein GY679_01595 [Mycoplasma sp.]|nr:hypothetical protein [Mycoplasma sp.]
MIDRYKKKIDNFVGFDFVESLESLDCFIFGGALRDIIADNKIHGDIDIVAGKDSAALIADILEYEGFESVKGNELNEYPVDIFDYPITKRKGSVEVQIIIPNSVAIEVDKVLKRKVVIDEKTLQGRHRFCNGSSLDGYSRNYCQAPLEMKKNCEKYLPDELRGIINHELLKFVSNVDLTCCALAYHPKKGTQKLHPLAIKHCKRKVFQVLEDNLLHHPDRLRKRGMKLIKRGWEETND